MKRFVRWLLEHLDREMLRPGDLISPMWEDGKLVLFVLAPEGWNRAKFETDIVTGDDTIFDRVEKYAGVIARAACGGDIAPTSMSGGAYRIIDPKQEVVDGI